MANRRFVSLLLALIFLSVSAHAAPAPQQNQADETVNKFLDSQKTETEDTQSQGSAVADLDGDGKSEIVLVWVRMGPTYSQHTLTVLAQTAGQYKPLASLPLTGEAMKPSVKGRVIQVEQMVFAKSDPRCCPSLKKSGRYRWAGRKIYEFKN